MHYEINYANMEEDAKRAKAIADVKSYLNDEAQFEKVMNAVRACDTLKQARFILSFAGIEGYPVQALWESK